MSAAVFIRPGRAVILPERLVIFVFVSWGALTAAFDLIQVPQMLSPRLVTGILLGSMLLFSASGFGWLLIPLEMLAFGNAFQGRVLAYYASASHPFFARSTGFFFASTLFLSVFLAAAYGLGASSALRDALVRGSPSARSRYQQKLSAAALCSVVSLASVFYFT